jgi:ABC-type branched-subunit amino acid transport system substrate-binding protein
VAVVALAAVAAAPGAGAQKEDPSDTEIGITADEIHVAIVADVDNPIRPGLNQQIVDAIEAWGKSVNKRGGLAERKVVVDFLDSHLNANEAANAFTEACEKDFVMVGTSAFAALNGDPIGACTDQAGTATGMPNLAGLELSPGSGSQPTTFPIAYVGQDFKVEGMVFNAQTGPALYVKEKLLKGDDVKHLSVLPAGVPGIPQSTKSLEEAGKAAGAYDEVLAQVAIADTAPQAQFTPIVQQIQREGVNSVLVISDISAAKLLKEAQTQGIDLSKTVFMCTSQCTTPGFLETAGSAAEGVHMFAYLAPFTDGKVPGVKEYVKGVGKDNTSVNAEYAYAAGLNFESLVARVVEKAGVNGLTRAAIIDEIKADPTTQTKGMMPKSNKLGVPNPCFALVTVKDGKFAREYPKKAGKFDCKKRNLELVEL